MNPVQLTSISRASPAKKVHFSLRHHVKIGGGKQEGGKGTLLLVQFNQESLSGLGRPLENKQQWEPLINPSELQSTRGKKKASNRPTEMAVICTRSSYPSGAFVPKIRDDKA